MPGAREYHGNSVFVGSLDHFLIAQRTTRLDDRGDSRCSRIVEPIPKREERIGRHDRPVHLESGVFRLDSSDS